MGQSTPEQFAIPGTAVRPPRKAKAKLLEAPDHGVGTAFSLEGSDGRVHLVETLAAAQKFGIDRADLVEHLAQFAEVGEELADFGVGCIRHVADPRALAGSTDCGKISLGAVPGSIGTVAVGPSAALVGLDQRAAQYLFDRRQAARELVATFEQGRG